LVGRFKRDAGRLQPFDARHGEDAAQGHVRRIRHVDEHHHGLQVAAPDPHQRLVAATRRERHADAECQSADDVRQPGQVLPGVDGVGEVDLARVGEEVGAEDGDRDGQQPGAHAAPVAHVDHVGNRAHGAEIGLVGEETEDETETETPPDNGLGYGLQFFRHVARSS
jgi:hypothetical protein